MAHASKAKHENESDAGERADAESRKTTPSDASRGPTIPFAALLAASGVIHGSGADAVTDTDQLYDD